MGSEQLFADEKKAFEEKKAELLKLCEGKFAAFKGAELIGIYDTAEAAYEAALAKFGNTPFFIKQVLREEPVEWIPAFHHGLIHASL
ncbi:MAG: hypothetical protein ABSE73_04370 [Planctomycetota bacterium]